VIGYEKKRVIKMNFICLSEREKREREREKRETFILFEQFQTVIYYK